MVTANSKLLVDVVLVARNAAASLDFTLRRLPRRGIRSVVVVDNGSTDNTGQVARDYGAVVLWAPTGGQGTATKRALRHLESLPVAPGVVVFLDPFGPEDPGEIERLLAPFRHVRAELVLATDGDEGGGQDLSDKAVLGLIGAIYGHRFTELSPCRAIRYAALVALGVRAEGDGWNVEMLVKAVRLGLHIVEVPVARVKKPLPPGRDRRGRLAISRKVLRILRHATAR